MKPPRVMLIAGETSGDRLAAELVRALRTQPGLAGATFFGAGGDHLRAAGADLAFDLTRHSVIGLVEALRHYRTFKALFDQLLALALDRRPDVLVCVDFSGFNRRFAAALRWEIRVRGAALQGWRPRLIQFVSPQVWASRPGRVRSMQRDLDLLLTIFPFEKDWYARHAPNLRVEFVGHPMLDRFAGTPPPAAGAAGDPPLVVLLPGSRASELRRHLPPMLEAARQLAADPARRVAFRMVLPDETRAAQARALAAAGPGLPLHIQVGGLAESLGQATLAMASTGTVTMECAFFRVPTVTLYRTSWTTYQIGRRIVTVKSLTMPNLLADAEVYPEFIQDAATGDNLARAARALLDDPARREAIRSQLDRVLATLGGPGATQRAAQAIADLMQQPASAG
ncbi:MAG: hypothetical protein RJA22_2915 [Verrucomicrobiota bacterium]|jgi:lipid-A-disaccharide synthase